MVGLKNRNSFTILQTLSKFENDFELKQNLNFERY
jgi:hypothetical protein